MHTWINHHTLWDLNQYFIVIASPARRLGYWNEGISAVVVGLKPTAEIDQNLIAWLVWDKKLIRRNWLRIQAGSFEVLSLEISDMRVSRVA